MGGPGRTRADIAATARRLFVSRGWSGTRVRDVAAEAGVAESTVYPVYGNKPGLALALVDAIDADAGLDDTSAEISRDGGDPAGQLAAMVGFDRRLFERGGDVVGLLSDAGRSEPDLAAAYQQGRARADQVRQRLFATWPTETFREGMDPSVGR